jgi:hypothetical protein
MVNYNTCHKDCKCFYYDKDKGSCIFKSLCKVMELPIEKEAVEDGQV